MIHFIWQAVLIIIFGTLLLRMTGKKAISEMTMAQTILMVAIGTLLIQPVVNKNIWITFGVASILVLTIVVIELIQIFIGPSEQLFTGKATILIENGIINENNLKKERLTVDQLEMNLRQKSVARLSDVKWATIEPNGQIGFMLKEDAQPVTKKEFQQLLTTVTDALAPLRINDTLTKNDLNESAQKTSDNLFQEVAQNKHNDPPTTHLQ